MTTPRTRRRPRGSRPAPGCGGSWRSLCPTEITSWGILYYAFPVLSGRSRGHRVVAAGDRRPRSRRQLVAARWSASRSDDARPASARGWLMTAGSVLAVPALVVVATAHDLPSSSPGGCWPGSRWARCCTRRLRRADPLVRARQCQSADGPHPGRRAGQHRLRPADRGAWSTDSDWRATYLVLAAILAVITVPGHFWGCAVRWPDPIRHDRRASGRSPRTLPQSARSSPRHRAEPGRVRRVRRGVQPRAAADRTWLLPVPRRADARVGRRRSGPRPPRLPAARRAHHRPHADGR